MCKLISHHHHAHTQYTHTLTHTPFSSPRLLCFQAVLEEQMFPSGCLVGACSPLAASQPPETLARQKWIFSWLSEQLCRASLITRRASVFPLLPPTTTSDCYALSCAHTHAHTGFCSAPGLRSKGLWASSLRQVAEKK